MSDKKRLLVVFDIDETQLVPGQDMSIYPGKIFRRQSGITGTAINGLKFPNTAQENLMMFDKLVERLRLFQNL